MHLLLYSVIDSIESIVEWIVYNLYSQNTHFHVRSQLATIVMAGVNDVGGVCVGGVLGHTICTGLAGINNFLSKLWKDEFQNTNNYSSKVNSWIYQFFTCGTHMDISFWCLN